MERNWSYTIQEGEHKGVTLWSGRYCAVCAMVFCRTNSKWYILANKRGSGTPDFQGYWNLPCGFIEANESGEQVASRETVEETGIFVYPNDFTFHSAETDPTISNNGNVTLRYIAKIYRGGFPKIGRPSGEENEVDSIKWIALSDIEDYNWAFHHKELLHKIIGEGIL